MLFWLPICEVLIKHFSILTVKCMLSDCRWCGSVI
jgi:hypothetical protein